MGFRPAILIIALVGLMACGEDDRVPTPTAAAQTTRPPGAAWNASAAATATRLAHSLRAGGIACDDYAPSNYSAIASDYDRRLPLPAAMSTCTSADGEDLTFEIFTDIKARDDFMATKLLLVCTNASEQGIVFPGFPYVEADAWLIEPDAEDTARKVAEIIGGTFKLAFCPD